VVHPQDHPDLVKLRQVADVLDAPTPPARTRQEALDWELKRSLLLLKEKSMISQEALNELHALYEGYFESALSLHDEALRASCMELGMESGDLLRRLTAKRSIRVLPELSATTLEEFATSLGYKVNSPVSDQLLLYISSNLIQTMLPLTQLSSFFLKKKLHRNQNASSWGIGRTGRGNP
jgi:hypothetical protein